MIAFTSKSDVDAIEEYDNNNSRQIACITARLTNNDSLGKYLVERLINASINKIEILSIS